MERIVDFRQIPPSRPNHPIFRVVLVIALLCAFFIFPTFVRLQDSFSSSPTPSAGSDLVVDDVYLGWDNSVPETFSAAPLCGDGVTSSYLEYFNENGVPYGVEQNGTSDDGSELAKSSGDGSTLQEGLFLSGGSSDVSGLTGSSAQRCVYDGYCSALAVRSCADSSVSGTASESGLLPSSSVLRGAPASGDSCLSDSDSVGTGTLKQANIFSKAFSKLIGKLLSSKWFGNDAKRALVSFIIATCGMSGLNVAIPEVDAFLTRSIPVIETMAPTAMSADEAAFVCMDELYCMYADGVAISSVPAQWETYAVAEVESLSTAGEFLSGAGGTTWEEALTSALATGKVPCSFVNANPEFFTWLAQVVSGGDFTALDGSPASVQSGGIDSSLYANTCEAGKHVTFTDSLPPIFDGFKAACNLNPKALWTMNNWVYGVRRDAYFTIESFVNSGSGIPRSSSSFGYTTISSGSTPSNPLSDFNVPWLSTFNFSYERSFSWDSSTGLYDGCRNFCPSTYNGTLGAENEGRMYINTGLDPSQRKVIFRIYNSGSALPDNKDYYEWRNTEPDILYSGDSSKSDIHLTRGLDTVLCHDHTVVGFDATVADNGTITDTGTASVTDVGADDYVAPVDFNGVVSNADVVVSDTTPDKTVGSTPVINEPGKTIGQTITDNKPTTPEKEHDKDDNPDFGDLTKVFPWCLPWDLYSFLDVLAADPVAPSFTYPLPLIDGSTYTATIDLSDFDEAAKALRVVGIIGLSVGLILITRQIIKG